VASLLATIVGAWALAFLLHWWPRLGAAWRRRVSIATNAAGLAFLIAAVRAEGLRESATTSMLLVGPSYLTDRASASASLYYYVLTAACLLLGFAGLAFGEPLARWLRRRWMLSTVLVAWLVTAVRFLLEKSAAPVPLVQAVGVTWLAPVAGAYLAGSLRLEATAGPRLLPTLFAYAYLVRGFVAGLGAAATRLGLGTHYDVSDLTEVPLALTGQVYTLGPASWTQIFWLILLPQLTAWSLFTVGAARIGAALASLLSPPRGVPDAPIAAAPLRGRDQPG
jgi:hypothetical protein